MHGVRLTTHGHPCAFKIHFNFTHSLGLRHPFITHASIMLSSVTLLCAAKVAGHALLPCTRPIRNAAWRGTTGSLSAPARRKPMAILNKAVQCRSIATSRLEVVTSLVQCLWGTVALRLNQPFRPIRMYLHELTT